MLFSVRKNREKTELEIMEIENHCVYIFWFASCLRFVIWIYKPDCSDILLFYWNRFTEASSVLREPEPAMIYDLQLLMECRIQNKIPKSERGFNKSSQRDTICLQTAWLAVHSWSERNSNFETNKKKSSDRPDHPDLRSSDSDDHSWSPGCSADQSS